MSVKITPQRTKPFTAAVIRLVSERLGPPVMLFS